MNEGEPWGQLAKTLSLLKHLAVTNTPYTHPDQEGGAGFLSVDRNVRAGAESPHCPHPVPFHELSK